MFTFKPDKLLMTVLLTRSFRIYAMDSTGESSPDLVVKINMCDCSEHGECSFDEPADEQPEGATNFVVASCECSLGWDGEDK